MIAGTMGLVTIAPSAAHRFRAIVILGFARDPRSEPKAGDVVAVEGWGGAHRAVVSVRHSPFAGKSFVAYKTDGGSHATVAIDRWRKWAAAGAVVKVAP